MTGLGGNAACFDVWLWDLLKNNLWTIIFSKTDCSSFLTLVRLDVIYILVLLFSLCKWFKQGVLKDPASYSQACFEAAVMQLQIISQKKNIWAWV